MPSITGGSQFEAGYGDHLVKGKAAFSSEELIGFPVEKRDFGNLDTRLYLALRAIVKDWIPMAEDAGNRMASEDPDYKRAREVMRDFEDSFGPTPEFAIARNFGLELTVGTQLFTKNGRRSGNGWLVRVDTQGDMGRSTRENPYGAYTVYTVLTDAGSSMLMTEQELEAQFEVGDWICTLDRIASEFDRHGIMKAMGIC